MKPEPLPLADWTLLSLRPQNQHAPVRRAASVFQAKTMALSSFRLQAVQDRVTLDTALACKIRIATSPAAVRHAQRQAPVAGHWLAIGQGTARALFRAGAQSVQVPDVQTAEGLLAMDALQRIQGRRIGLLTAPDGRGLLEETLLARGAILSVAHVYTRQAVTLNARQLAALDRLSAESALLVTSQKAFDQLWAQLNAARRGKIKSLICVASSVRLLEYLTALGLVHVICSNSTLPQRQLEVLAETVTSAKVRSHG
jgi:uroporphyrinogen-III synthase